MAGQDCYEQQQFSGDYANYNPNSQGAPPAFGDYANYNPNSQGAPPAFGSPNKFRGDTSGLAGDGSGFCDQSGYFGSPGKFPGGAAGLQAFMDASQAMYMGSPSKYGGGMPQAQAQGGPLSSFGGQGAYFGSPSKFTGGGPYQGGAGAPMHPTTAAPAPQPSLQYCGPQSAQNGMGQLPPHYGGPQSVQNSMGQLPPQYAGDMGTYVGGRPMDPYAGAGASMQYNMAPQYAGASMQHNMAPQYAGASMQHNMAPQYTGLRPSAALQYPGSAQHAPPMQYPGRAPGYSGAGTFMGPACPPEGGEAYGAPMPMPRTPRRYTEGSYAEAAAAAPMTPGRYGGAYPPAPAPMTPGRYAGGPPDLGPSAPYTPSRHAAGYEGAPYSGASQWTGPPMSPEEFQAVFGATSAMPPARAPYGPPMGAASYAREAMGEGGYYGPPVAAPAGYGRPYDREYARAMLESGCARDYPPPHWDDPYAPHGRPPPEMYEPCARPGRSQSCTRRPVYDDFEPYSPQRYRRLSRAEDFECRPTRPLSVEKDRPPRRAPPPDLWREAPGPSGRYRPRPPRDYATERRYCEPPPRAGPCDDVREDDRPARRVWDRESRFR